MESYCVNRIVPTLNEFTWCQLAVAAAQQQQGAAAFGGGGAAIFGQPYDDATSHQFLDYNQFPGGGGGSAYSFIPGATSNSKPMPPSSSYFPSSSGKGNNVFDSSAPSNVSSSGRLVSRERSTSAPNVCIHNTNILFDSPNSALYPPSSGGSLGYGSGSRRLVTFLFIFKTVQLISDRFLSGLRVDMVG